MNVHHLELFYYVAKAGGISAAVRQIPYGIQQPAVSGQMAKLEEAAGAVLFERSPFRLTPAGGVLFEHVRPFFEGLGPLRAALRAEAEPEVRLGGSEFVLREHIPAVMTLVKTHFPRLRFSMRTGFQVQLEEWLRAGEIELAATLVDERPPAKLRRLRLANVPLVLQVPAAYPITSADQLWAEKRLAEPLIALPATTQVTRNFQRGLKRLGVTWPQTIEAGSIDLLTRYVANGDGFGVNIAIESVAQHPGVRVLPLDGFAPITMGLVWRGEPSPVVRTMIGVVQAYSRRTWPEWFVEDALP